MAQAKSTKSTTKKAAPKKKAATKKSATKKAAPEVETMTQTAKTTDSYSDFTPYQPAEGEEYMNAPQLKHFRNILASWKQELMEKVDETVHHMQDEAGNIPDPNDRASQESDFTMELRTRDRERKLIKKIESSIKHLDDGEYGFCNNCGEEIGIRRLEARPTAELCIDCKTLDEIREKHVNR